MTDRLGKGGVQKKQLGLKNRLCGLETEAQARALCGTEAQCATRISPEECNTM